MKNLIAVLEPSNTVFLSALNTGEFGIIATNSWRHSQRSGHVVLRMGEYAIDLNDSYEFPAYELGDIQVRIVPDGSKLTITVGAGEQVKLLPSQLEEVKSILRTGNKINAIKRVREFTNAGLKESKDYVDALTY